MIQKILENLKIESLNQMQESALKAAIKPGDLVLLSPTGSGKTLGFLLPLIESLDKTHTGIQALILVPSRELALQIEQVFKQMGTGFKVNCCYGGHDTKIERNNLSHPPAVLVGTPGRIAFHIRNGYINTDTITTLILDEFDKSLEFGFEQVMSGIIADLTKIKKRMLISATRMPEVPAFTGLRKPTVLDFLDDKKQPGTELSRKYLRATDKDKLDLLVGLICKLGSASTLIFCNHRDAVERVGALLEEMGISHGIFHGGMDQDDREKALIKFRNGTHRLLITTDLASRGLDIPEIEAVIHYQLPVTVEVYTHRNGRTARMHANGTSYILLSASEHIPPFIPDKHEEETLPLERILPKPSIWKTLYIGAGKKDKINKMDIVGTLLQKGNLGKDELGLVEVLDNASFAAIKADKITKVFERIKNEKIKNKKVRFGL
jgi:ATP-independent RNA helicase DbpA